MKIKYGPTENLTQVFSLQMKYNNTIRWALYAIMGQLLIGATTTELEFAFAFVVQSILINRRNKSI